MKTALAALATALVLPGLALAQTAAPAPAQPATAQSGAAATLPNTFDGPPQAARPAPAPEAPAPEPDVTPSSPAKVAATEAVLKTTIAAMQAGQPNYADMTPDLAEKVRAQSDRLLPVFQQIGALQSVIHVGTENGAELFTVVFANAPTQWIIALNEAGKITVVLFRPAPAPEPAPAA